MRLGKAPGFTSAPRNILVNHRTSQWWRKLGQCGNKDKQCDLWVRRSWRDTAAVKLNTGEEDNKMLLFCMNLTAVCEKTPQQTRCCISRNMHTWQKQNKCGCHYGYTSSRPVEWSVLAAMFHYRTKLFALTTELLSVILFKVDTVLKGEKIIV